MLGINTPNVGVKSASADITKYLHLVKSSCRRTTREICVLSFLSCFVALKFTDHSSRINKNRSTPPPVDLMLWAGGAGATTILASNHNLPITGLLSTLPRTNHIHVAHSVLARFPVHIDWMAASYPLGSVSRRRNPLPPDQLTPYRSIQEVHGRLCRSQFLRTSRRVYKHPSVSSFSH